MVNLIGRTTGTLFSENVGVYTATDEWQLATIGGNPVAYYEGSIDLGGLVREEKTFFPTNVMVQGPQLLYITGATTGETYTDVEIISTNPLSETDILWAANYQIPGMNNNFTLGTLTGQDLQTIVFGQIRTWVVNSTVTLPTLVNQDNFGTNEGIASSELYYYRIISAPPVAGSITAFPTALVVSGGLFEEPELERLMRMKRNTRIGV